MHSGQEKQDWDLTQAPCTCCFARIATAQAKEQPTLPAGNETAMSFTLKICEDRVNPRKHQGIQQDQWLASLHCSFIISLATE